MKKIFSLILAFSMFASLTFSVNAANIDVDKNLVSYSIEKLDNSVFDTPTGETTYKITADLKDFGTLTRVKDGMKYSGTKLQGVSIFFTIDKAMIDADYCMVDENKFEAVPSASYSDADGSYNMIWGAQNEESSLPTKASGLSEITNLDDMVVIYITIKSTESLNVKASNVVAITEFSKGNAGDTYKYAGEETITLGTPAGPTFTDDTQTTMAKDAEKVNADGTYNVGVKADAIVVPAGSTATKIKFGFSTDDATALRTTASYEVVLPTAVQSGAVSVALNVTSVPEGVVLTYTGATVE